MTPERLGQLDRDLHATGGIIAGWRRHRAARELATEASPEALRLLAEAASYPASLPGRAPAREALQTITDPGAAAAIVPVWAASRDAFLEALLIERGWMVQEPAELYVLSGLKTGRIEPETVGADVVPALLRAARDRDPRIAASAREVLLDLPSAEARDAVCREVIDRADDVAWDVALAAGYAPTAPGSRAIFYFLTAQWAEYESLDFDHSLLQAAYAAGSAPLQSRVAARARGSGRVEWVQAASGGRQGLRLGDMTDAEWEAVLAVLAGLERGADLWRLAQEAPARWSARILKGLRRSRWKPSAPAEAEGFEILAEEAERWFEPKPGALLRAGPPMNGSGEPVQCLAVSPDGARLAAGGRYGTLRLFDLPGRIELRRVAAHSQSIEGVAFDSQSSLLAAGSSDGAVKLWILPDLQAGPTLSGHREWVTAAASSSRNTVLATASQDGVLRLWSLPGGEPAGLRRGLEGGITALSLNSVGSLLACAAGEKVHLFSLPDLREVQVLTHPRPVSAVVLTADSRLLASGSDDGAVSLWDCRSGRLFQRVKAHSSGVTSLAAGPTGNVLISAGYDRQICCLLLPQLVLLRRLNDLAASISSVAITADGLTLAAGCSNGEVAIWTWELCRLSRLPARQVTLPDLEWTEGQIEDETVPRDERAALRFLAAQARWQRRFDIVVEDAPHRIQAGEWEIEIEG